MARETKVDVYMPLFVGDYLADTSHLSCEEDGAYLRLLMHLWRQDGRLLYDHDQLARICKLSRKRWDATWKTLAPFFDVADGFLTQGRVSHELAVAYAKKKEASEAGKRGAEKRWGPHGHPMATPLATPMRPQWRNDSSSSSSPSSPEELDLSARDPGATEPEAGPPPPSPPPQAWQPPRRWSNERWRELYGRTWCEKYQQVHYGMASDGTGLATLADLLERMPPAEVERVQARAPAMFAEFLADASPNVVKARHPFAFFVTAFGGLSVDAKAIPAAASSRCGWHAKGGRGPAHKPRDGCPDCKEHQARTAGRTGEPTTAASAMPDWARIRETITPPSVDELKALREATE